MEIIPVQMVGAEEAVNMGALAARPLSRLKRAIQALTVTVTEADQAHLTLGMRVVAAAPAA